MSESVFVEEDTSTFHVQVRLYRSGPKKADGRRGDIILEDKAAPPGVARWLQSATCCRGAAKSLKGATVDIWIDAKAVGDHSITIPDADAPQEPEKAAPRPLPAVLDSASLAAVRAYQDRLEALTEDLERDLRDTRDRHREEVARIRADRDAEVAAADAAIESARLRLQLVLTREDEELELLQARRSKLNSERAKLSEDLSRDQETYREIKEGLAGSLSSPGVIASTIDSATKALENEAVQTVIFKAMEILSKK